MMHNGIFNNQAMGTVTDAGVFANAVGGTGLVRFRPIRRIQPGVPPPGVGGMRGLGGAGSTALTIVGVIIAAPILLLMFADDLGLAGGSARRNPLAKDKDYFATEYRLWTKRPEGWRVRAAYEHLATALEDVPKKRRWKITRGGKVIQEGGIS
jgi:hypothetical protein